MIGTDIQIANRLEVFPGNIINVPGCEPLSSFTSTTLEANIVCKASVLPVNVALEAIPGSTIVVQQNPFKMFFVLPSGPPTQPGCNACASGVDYYQILRDAAPPPPPKPTEPGPCDGFGFNPCA